MIFLDKILVYIHEFIACVGVLVIAYGVLQAFVQLAFMLLRGKQYENQIRLQLGKNLVLGLEFMIGADIISFLFTPTYYNVGLLVIIVALRTLLSYFLQQELQGIAQR